MKKRARKPKRDRAGESQVSKPRDLGHPTRTRDKVQVIGAVEAMQAARRDEVYAISSIAAHPCKKRKDGAPHVRLWE